MKILLDQNVDRRIKSFLESQGFDVDTTYDQGLSSESDENILKYCLEEEYAILTHDDDFLTIKDEKDVSPSIVLLPQRIRFREMKRRLKDLEIESKKGLQIFP